MVTSGSPVLLCTDGSELAVRALARGLELLRPDAPLTLVTVMDEPDPSLVTGAGFAGGTMTADQFEELVAAAEEDARRALQAAAGALGLEDIDREVLRGAAGPALCGLAAEVGAAAMVLGSRGHGGLRRAVLGSVSDHIVRNAPCPVVVTGDAALDGDD